MTESNLAPVSKTSFEDHPLYEAAMEAMGAGDEAAAAAKLRQLAKEFPGEQVVRDLLVRSELRATLATSEPVPAVHGEPAPVLRRVVLILLTLTIALAGIAGFAAAYDRLVLPARESRQQELHLESLRHDGQARLEAGDWTGAREAFQEILVLVPGDPSSEAGIQYANQQEALDQQYLDAVSALERGDVQTALSLFRQIEAQNPGYRDVGKRIQTLEEEVSLEAAWLESETLIQAADWLGAITVLTRIRAQNPDFRRSQVEEQLYQVYAQLARELIAQANGSVESLREAVGYLDQALALRPTRQDLVEERRLAAGYVAGADAYAREDWASAVTHWEPIYTAQPDYQGGELRKSLRELFPNAARQLIAQANGNVSTLKQAIGYLDQALVFQPGSQDLIEERRLAVDFVAGAEAFAQEDWNGAISYWGAIYAIRPAYQNGLLEEQLRQACGSSPTPSAELCPP